MGPTDWGEKTSSLSNGEQKRYICGSGPIHESEKIELTPHEEMFHSFNMMKGADNLNKAIESFQLKLKYHQPICMDPTTNCKFQNILLICV